MEYQIIKYELMHIIGGKQSFDEQFQKHQNEGWELAGDIKEKEVANLVYRFSAVMKRQIK